MTQPQQPQQPQGNVFETLNPSDVASVSSAGVSVAFRSEKEKLEAEILRASLNDNPIRNFNSADHSFRR